MDDPVAAVDPEESAVPAPLVPGGGGEATFAELPAPVGSLPELLRPPTSDGLEGTPLTPPPPELFSPGVLLVVTQTLARNMQQVRKLIAFDDDTFDKLKQLGRDRMATIQELADEAFADVLKKHGIPVDLKDALRKSASLSQMPATTTAPQKPARSKSSRKTKS
jgi:hypothetical protein